jgi:molybdate transport system substrate-binding protein
MYRCIIVNVTMVRITLFKKKPEIVAGLLLAFLLFQISSALADDLRVAVASNFLLPVKELSRKFEKSTANKVGVISASTGKLYAQIKQGAPFDVLLAADSLRPELLEKEGIGVPGSRFTYAVGRLALWSADTKLFLKNDLQVLNQKNFRYLAIANPKTAPYGKAAEQVLRKKGFWNQLQTRLVRGENISQTFQFLVTGNADIGFIALSQSMRNQGQLKGYSWTVPSDWHDPIRQQAILLKRAKTNKVAKEFLNFIKSNRVQKIIESYGYSLER